MSPPPRIITAVPDPDNLPLFTTLKNHHVRVIATMYSLAFLSIIFVIFRIYCRIAYHKTLLLTDVFLVLGLCFQMAVQGCSLANILRKMEAYAPMITSRLLGFHATILQLVAFWCLRMSISILFSGIFFTGKARAAKIIIYFSMIVATVTTWVPLFMIVGCAAPFLDDGKYVELNIYKACNRNTYRAMVVQASAGLAFDIAAVVLPIIPIWKLQMSVGKKISLTLLLGLGCITVVASGMRLRLSINHLNAKKPIRQGAETSYALFGAVEMHVGIIASCFITTWRVIQLKFLPNFFVRFFSSLGFSSPLSPSDDAGGSGPVRIRNQHGDQSEYPSANNRETGKSSTEKSQFEIESEAYELESRDTDNGVPSSSVNQRFVRV